MPAIHPNPGAACARREFFDHNDIGSSDSNNLERDCRENPVPTLARYDTVAALAASAFAVPLGELRAQGRRSATAALARHSAMYLAHVVLGASFTRIGAAFGRDRTTVAHACRRIEELRDDPDMDNLLTRLEDALAAYAEDAQ